ncbi:putative NADP-dependent oxidoreductase domain-containing protein 1 [Apostichopus japonicus]|uniref:Putative NADP-dependent oxidoreductase domain-containing protein 1 n=1 Tax=Stichopus japonicus TaxID=307972 RepID=A0A2G8LIA2_STIJA|nr:putative NADP-dependent oxidoreductase domain-containing protein 1 [Apostichopus japonicus]
MATSIDISNLNIVSDITRDLPSLQFESSLTEDEKPYLGLRVRSHAIGSSLCGQATYFTAILNQARQNILELKTPPQTKASKLLRDAPPRDPLLVGLIGCGRLGTQLANCLLTYADVQSSELLISTRRPELLNALSDRGVRCFYDNHQLVQSANLIFLCVLPSHLADVVEEIRGSISATSTVYSFLSSVPLSKLRYCLGFPAVVKADLSWSAEDSGLDWDCTEDVCTVLENQVQVEMTCPLNLLENCFIQTDTKWAELLLYTFLNLCTSKELSQEETVSLVNQIVLGQLASKEYDVRFTSLDFTRRKGKFPIFDIAAVASRETPLTKTINQNTELRALFVKQYKNIFDKFYYWKGIKQLKKKSEEGDVRLRST